MRDGTRRRATQEHKIVARVALTVVMVLSLLVCALAQRGVRFGAFAAGEFGQIDFTPHITPLILQGTAPPPPMATLGPGQSFGRDHPEVLRIEDGDEQYGYGPLAENPDLYLIWAPIGHNPDGSLAMQYLVVRFDSEMLRGTLDPTTHQTYPNGFDKYVRDYETELNALRGLLDEINENRRLFGDFGEKGFGVGLIGGGICLLATMGLCTLVLAAAGGLGVSALVNDAEAKGLEEHLETYQDRLIQAQDDVISKLREAFARTPSP